MINAGFIATQHGTAGEPQPPFTPSYADARGAAVVAGRVGKGRVIYWSSALPAPKF